MKKKIPPVAEQRQKQRERGREEKGSFKKLYSEENIWDMSAEQGTTARSRSQRAVIPLGAPCGLRTRTWSESWGSVGAASRTSGGQERYCAVWQKPPQ